MKAATVMSSTTATGSRIHLAESFDNKILQLADKDTADAIAGAALALATMEIARQQTVQNLIGYLALGGLTVNLELRARASIDDALNLGD